MSDQSAKAFWKLSTTETLAAFLKAKNPSSAQKIVKQAGFSNTPDEMKRCSPKKTPKETSARNIRAAGQGGGTQGGGTQGGGTQGGGTQGGGTQGCGKRGRATQGFVFRRAVL